MNPLATMLLTSRSGEPLVLEGVSASGQLHDALLTMTIEQRYRNPGTKHIEAVYTFPLPWGAVLMTVEVDLDGKSLSGQVHARPQAEAKYEAALSEGDAAILLERNRDGTHTLNLGNLAPGEQCCIRIRYAQSMCVEQGSVRLMLPTVIAPRYGDALAGGLQPQQVPKVDWLAAYPLEVTVDIFGSLAAARVASPSHPMAVGPITVAGAQGVRVSLSRQSWLDRDVVLLLGPVAHDSLGQALADPFAPGHTAVKLALKPRVPPRTTPLRLKVLVDCSGSMGGDSMESAREALQSIVSQLEEQERFSLSRFGSTVEHRSRALWAVTPATRQGAKRWVAQLDANLGGTEMEEALASTFALGLGTADVLLVTDGQITTVADTVALAQSSGHRVFVVGIGAAANDQLIYALAEATGGACEFVAPGEAVAPAVLRMFHRLRGGHVSDVQLNWPNGIKPVWQQTLPKSVFDGDTVPVHALLAGPVDGTLTLVGRLQTNSEPLDLATLTLLPNPEATDSEASTLARMVAWAQVKELANASATAPLRQRITQLAVTYQLVTDESCFVLVHQRADADKALDMPEQTRVKQMLAAGWGGTSSVTGRLESGSVHSIVRPRTSSSKSSARKLVAPAALQQIAKPMPRFENALRGQSHGFDAGDVFFSRGHCFGNMDSFDGDLLADLKNARHSDRADARLWASGVSYTGLTPLGLAQWLGQHPAADWPTDVDALAAVGVGQAVIDWIEFVLAVRWRVMAEGIPPVTALLCWLDKAEVRAFLTATLNASTTPVLPTDDMAAALTGITARAWPAQVFALEVSPLPNIR